VKLISTLAEKQLQRETYTGPLSLLSQAHSLNLCAAKSYIHNRYKFGPI